MPTLLSLAPSIIKVGWDEHLFVPKPARALEREEVIDITDFARDTEALVRALEDSIQDWTLSDWVVFENDHRGRTSVHLKMWKPAPSRGRRSKLSHVASRVR